MGDVSPLYVPGLSSGELERLNVNLDRLRRCRHANWKRACLYDGKNAMPRSAVVPDQYYRLGIALGWSGKAVDALTRRTQLQTFTWPSGDLDSLGMAELSRDNFLRSEVTQALTDSALYGISFLITTQGREGEPEALVHARDAMQATGTWNPRTRRLDDALTVDHWSDSQQPEAFTLYLKNLTVTAVRERGRWLVDHSEHLLGVPVEPLVYKPRPSRRYGQSRLTKPIMGLHQQAVRELVRLEGHMDVYSYPEMWMLGGDMSAFKNADGSQKAVWQVMLGRIKGLQDNPDKPDDLARPEVKQFPAASPAPHSEMLDLLSRAFAREASLPDSSVALRGTSNPTSAEAYDASQYELIAEAEGAMADWSAPLSRTVARGLAIMNDESSVPTEWMGVEPVWLGAKFESRAAKADAGMKQVSAVPWLADTKVGLELLGLSDLQIDQALSEKRRMQGSAALQMLQQRQAATRDGGDSERDDAEE